MVLEQFSAVVGSVGLLSSMFALSVNAVAKISAMEEDWKNCYDRLILMKHQVENNRDRMQTLMGIWNLSSPKDLDFLLGEDGILAMEPRIGNVASSEVAVEALLTNVSNVLDAQAGKNHGHSFLNKRGYRVPVQERSTWDEWASATVRSLAAAKTQGGPQIPFDIAMRVAYILVGSAAFSARLSMLEDSVETLKQWLDNRFAALPDVGGKPKTPAPKYLNVLLSLQERSAEFGKFMTAVARDADTSLEGHGILL